MLEAWEQEYSHQIEERRRLSDSLSAAQNRLSTGWRPDKGTGRHQRQSRAPGVVQQVKRQTAELEAHEITMPRPPLRLKMPSLHARPTVTYLSAESISLVGRLKGPVNFTLRGGDKLLVTGPNGAGKSTLLRLLTQQLPPSTGEVGLRESTRLSLVGQENPEWNGKAPAGAVFEQHVAEQASAHKIRPDQMIGLGELGLLDAAAQATPVKYLSQGQQRRLELAMRLAERPHVLLLDEPSNHMAMQLMAELTEALKQTQACVVAITHDRQMIAELSSWKRLQLN